MKILVPIDGSKYSKKALLKAKELATALKGQVTILNVIKPVIDYRCVHNKEFFQEAERELLKGCRKLLDEAEKQFTDFEGEVKALYKRGDPAEEIVKRQGCPSYKDLCLNS